MDSKKIKRKMNARCIKVMAINSKDRRWTERLKKIDKKNGNIWKRNQKFSRKRDKMELRERKRRKNNI